MASPLFKLGPVGGARRLIAALLVAGGGLLGCAPQPVPPVMLDLAGVQPKVDYSDLGAVLKKALDSRGTILPDRAKEWSEGLDRQLKLLAVTGPTATPSLLASAEDRLAYWYNARAAWSLKLVELAQFPDKLPAAALEDRPLPLDGRTMTLKDIDAILAQDGWQAEVAAPGALIQRAALPAKPLVPAEIRQEVRRRLAGFLDDDKRFTIDIDGKRILVPPVLWKHRDALLRRHRQTYGAEGATLATALLPYFAGSPLRRLQDAIGYPCVAAPPSRQLAVPSKR